jgi:rhamnosyltransferase
MKDSFAVAIPLYHSAKYIPRLARGIESQTIQPSALILIDSSTDQSTVLALKEHGLNYHRISPSEFSHGGTRNLAANLAKDQEIDWVIMLTHDVNLVCPDAFENLLSGIDSVDAVCGFGRQICSAGATKSVASAKESRFPAHSYISNSQSGKERYFLSNAFAAYRVRDLLAVGGFPEDVVFGEDAVASYRLQKAGHNVVYVAEAVVEHWHEFSMLTEFRRHFDIGVAVGDFPEPELWAPKSGGVRQLMEELRLTIDIRKPSSISRALTSVLMKACGYIAGRHAELLPISLRCRVSYSGGKPDWRRGPD